METVDYQPDTLVDGEPMPLIVMEPRGSGEDKNRRKKIEAPPQSTFRLGSKVDCFGLKWLVTEVNRNEEIKLQGTATLCNFILKWQDDDTLEYVFEECVVERYKTAAVGVSENRVISTDDTRRNVLIQFNDKTRKLKQGKRFYIDMEGVNNPKVYELTDLDRTSYVFNGVGFFQLVCNQNEKVPDDRDDIMICNWNPPRPDQPLPIGSCEITYAGDPSIRAGATSWKPFTAVFLDSSGNEITPTNLIWELTMLTGLAQNQVRIRHDSDTAVSLQALNGTIGHRILLKVSYDHDFYGYMEASVEIEIVSLF
jgi:hypothetical protein